MTKFKLGKYKIEILAIAALIILYIFIRSLHFPEVFNFSSEQAAFAMKARQLWDTKKIELIGPPISWRYEGRYFFQGSLTYYAIIPFLLLGGWDPIRSTYLMVLFGALMLIPLYFGARMLVSKKAAFLIAVVFTLLPFYIDYSRFFWNPTLQLLFSPLVILWMGLYNKYKKTLFLFLISFTCGILLLFHYQYILVIMGLVVCYRLDPLLRGYDGKKFGLFLLGFLLGFSPMIIFELRNHFYNIQTLLLFITHRDVVFPKGNGVWQIFGSYYMLSPLLFIFVGLAGRYTKLISDKTIVVITLALFANNLLLYVPAPQHAFGMAKDWNYPLEKKTNDIIVGQKLSNYNIVHLGYDTVATVQKYLLETRGVKGNFNDYYHNKYLFVITDEQDYMKNPSYEINTFTPNVIIQKWQLNERYLMYLLKR
ncbi:hypothetical protein COY90_01770 [Candidatus Roizmanbacteria bacterium CG_4_10_14_0_8_um_filter_39_9]|uniref:Glycosyltransferase RgtA/B/C/D-like domain-containing protein n=1 Tax=Candidatus Roizmanbacteria bacterium CG_4_10_14_0_8_um_filter_39_9 TaxID=1974829 RepID=A0A2M7QDE4_9BACT|nr:MAG: hypothetical protein COY90_01770 [Candidatus Roizmanbacteria bacterium CG_4_10_14_0_8_um_filter_39_9]